MSAKLGLRGFEGEVGGAGSGNVSLFGTEWQAFGTGPAERMFYCGGEPRWWSFPVPVTAKLSRRFYETFGDEIANELVEWFNQVDATYRADLLQINEMNFSRFDAKLEQRIAELDANWDRKFSNGLAELRSALLGQLTDLRVQMEGRFARLDSQWRENSARIEQFDTRTVKLESKIDRLEDRTAKIASRIDESAAETKAELIKWMFVFWAGTVLSLGGLFYGLVR